MLVGITADAGPELRIGDGELDWISALKVAVRVALVALAIGIAGCGDNDSSSLATSPGATPSPTATPTAPPQELSIVYRLEPVSTILFSSGIEGMPALSEPISGSLIVQWSSQRVPNSYFSYSVVGVDLHSDHFMVGLGIADRPGLGLGCVEQYGCIYGFTLDDHTYMAVALAINGQPYLLNGRGPYDPNRYPPVLTGIQLCSAKFPVSCDDIQAGTAPGYLLALFASVET